MNHSYRPPENNHRILVFTKAIILSTVATATRTNIIVVSKSNNIIFTLNLSNY